MFYHLKKSERFIKKTSHFKYEENEIHFICYDFQVVMKTIKIMLKLNYFYVN